MTQSLRVMTYNMLHSGVGGRASAIARVAARVAPDILAAQETTDRRQIEQLAEQLGLHLVHGDASSGLHGAILSRFPLELQPTVAQPGALAKTVVRAHIETPTRTLDVVSAHLSAQPWFWRHTRVFRQREVAEVLRLAAGADLLMGDFNARAPLDPIRPIPPPRGPIGPRPSYPMTINTVVRAASLVRPLRPLMRLMVNRGFPPVIIRAAQRANWVDLYRQRNSTRPGYTWPAPWPLARIDFIFGQPWLADQVRRVAPISDPDAWYGSDHLPVVADFVF